jgi:hypothetical protein
VTRCGKIQGRYKTFMQFEKATRRALKRRVSIERVKQETDTNDDVDWEGVGGH